MCETCEYIEAAKECPNCGDKALYFTTIIQKVSREEYIGKLGVKCRNCGYKTKVYQKET